MEKVYHKPTSTICDLTDNLKQEIKDKGNVKEYAKILALPEHFSDKHLQAIVEGKMKDGDKVLVKCVEGNYNYRCFDESQFEFYTHLDQQNHITLYPVQQSLEEAAEEYFEKELDGTEYHLEYLDPEYDAIDVIEAFKAGTEWAKKNNY